MPIDAAAGEEIVDEVLSTTKREYRVLLELKLISSEFSTGSVYVIPSKANSLLWNGIIFVRSGAFKDAVLRFKIQLDASYPNQKNTPELRLEFPFEHPLVSPETCAFETSHAFPSWSESEHLYSLLKYFKYALENFEFCASLPSDKIANPAIVELHRRDAKEFSAKAREMTVRSVNELFAGSDEDNVFAYERSAVEEDEEIHQSIVENMKTAADNLPEGFSFLFDNRRSLN